METKIKRRVTKACDGCRRKKIKCEVVSEGFCASCVHKNTSCTYNLTTKKRGPAKGYVSVLESRLERLEGILKKQTKKTEKRQDAYKKLDQEREKHPFFKGEQYISNNSIAWIFTNTIRSQAHQLGIQIHGGNHGDCYYVRALSAEKDRRPSQIEQLVELGIIKSDASITSVEDWILAVANIDKLTSDRLLEVFFSNIHPLVPVLNKKVFLADYRGLSLSYPEAPLLYAIYGAAACYVRNANLFNDWHVFPHGEIWDIPSTFAELMYKNLVGFVRGPYTPCLAYIQALAISHYLSTSFDSWKDGWFLNCLAIRMSQDLGLHRLSKDWDIPEEEKEARRNVWWAVYVLDRWFSACTGKPMTAFDEDCDEIYPSENVTIDELMDKMSQKDTKSPRFPTLANEIESKIIGDVIPLYQPFLQLIKLSEILGRILHSLYTPKAKKFSSECDSIVKHLGDSLTAWHESLPPLLQDCTRKKGVVHNSPSVSLSGVISISYFTLLILLHRPFIERDSSESSQQSLDICTGAAIRIIEVSESMESRDFLLVCWSFALYPVFTAILIHLYNCTNPNSIIADVAKSNLVRGLATIDRLCYLSSTAKHISTIVKQLVTSSPIFKGDPAFCEILQTEVTQATQSPPDAMEVQERDFNWINQLYAPSPLNVKDTTFDPMFSMHQRQPGETYNQSYPFMTDNSTDPSSLFRNNPNNPFWAVPSSMGVDDWQDFFKS